MEKELRFLEKLKRKRRPKCFHIGLGIGDDCALVDDLLVTKDMFVEGIHFTWDTLTPYEVGRKALLASVSDIAAMGGVPFSFLLGLSFPGDENVFDEIVSGVDRVSEELGIVLCGGDVSGSESGTILSVTVFGRSSNPIKRSGAGKGDLIFVTGTLGDSSLGLELIRRDLGDKFSYLVWRHKNPVPRVREGVLLSSLGIASSMIDISDGLAVDLIRVASSSGLGFRIYWEKLPVSHEFRKAVDFLGDANPAHFILYGGEDYELLFTVPRDRVGSLASLPFHVTFIGEMLDSGFWLVREGKEIPLKPGGYDHFEK